MIGGFEMLCARQLYLFEQTPAIQTVASDCQHRTLSHSARVEHMPNLASRLLALNVKRLSRDWLCFHGHPVLLAETFVDADRFRGTYYRAAGWQTLGATRGYSKSNKSYWHNGRPKLVLIRPLVPDAASRLAAPFVPASNTNSKEEIWMIDVNRLPLQSEGGLIDTLRTIVDPRKPRCVRQPVVTIVAIAVCAVLSGARSFQVIAEWAQTLGRDTLRQLGSKHRPPPSEIPQKVSLQPPRMSKDKKRRGRTNCPASSLILLTFFTELVLLGLSSGAEGGTRTPTRFPSPPPQDGVSTNSTTSAFDLLEITAFRSVIAERRPGIPRGSRFVPRCCPEQREFAANQPGSQGSQTLRRYAARSCR
jgi:hypothetical protein